VEGCKNIQSVKKVSTSRGVKNRRPNSFREEIASFSSGTHLRF